MDEQYLLSRQWNRLITTKLYLCPEKVMRLCVPSKQLMAKCDRQRAVLVAYRGSYLLCLKSKHN